MRIDLHMHSTGSDGQYSPAQLMKKAQLSGLTVVALTDHDSVAGLDEAKIVAADLGIDFIPGIEISCKFNGELHMLGYGIQHDSVAIKMACDRFVELRDIRAQKILAYLIAHGIKLTLNEVKEQAGGRILARPHFARAMLANGYVHTYREAFDKYLATTEFEQIERPKPEPAKGIKIIHDGGGLAVLAHPKSLHLTGEILDRQIKELVSVGLDGIETYYGSHTAGQIAEYHLLAKKYGLLETAGSDFHGEKIKPDIQLGRCSSEDKLLVSENMATKLTRTLLEKMGSLNR